MLTAFLAVVFIDIILAGDNAIVVGALAAGLPQNTQRQVIAAGIGAALVLRIVFALMVSWLMMIPGLELVGGLLLLWVAWKMYRGIEDAGKPNPKVKAGFWAAAWAVTVADVSMSLDNVLGVAGAAREHPFVLVFGLLLSVALMGVAATAIAQLIEKHRWLSWVGVGVIVLVAIKMILSGVGIL